METKVGSRRCFRCGKDLTDPVSCDVGVGPHCRKMDNVLLAKTYSADLGVAQLAFNGIESFLLPTDCIEKFYSIEGDLAGNKTGDWRKTVRAIEWILSFPLPKKIQDSLCHIVSSFGYTKLVNLWQGKFTTSSTVLKYNATLKCFELFCTRNNALTKALSKHGIYAQRKGYGANAHYSFSVESTTSIHGIIPEYFLSIQGFEAALTQFEECKAELIKNAPSMLVEPMPFPTGAIFDLEYKYGKHVNANKDVFNLKDEIATLAASNVLQILSNQYLPTPHKAGSLVDLENKILEQIESGTATHNYEDYSIKASISKLSSLFKDHVNKPSHVTESKVYVPTPVVTEVPSLEALLTKPKTQEASFAAFSSVHGELQAIAKATGTAVIANIQNKSDKALSFAAKYSTADWKFIGEAYKNLAFQPTHKLGDTWKHTGQPVDAGKCNLAADLLKSEGAKLKVLTSVQDLGDGMYSVTPSEGVDSILHEDLVESFSNSFEQSVLGEPKAAVTNLEALSALQFPPHTKQKLKQNIIEIQQKMIEAVSSKNDDIIIDSLPHMMDANSKDSPKSVWITKSSEPVFYLVSPKYDFGFVNELKASVHYKSRFWDKEVKAWAIIGVDNFSKVLRLAKKAFGKSFTNDGAANLTASKLVQAL